MSNQISITENITTVEVVSNNPTVLEIEQSNQILVAETGANIPAALGEIRDVDLSPAPTDGQVLTYDATGGVWQPGSIPEVDLSSRLKLDQTIPQQGVGQFDINVKRTKTLVVDAAGRGDYTTIKAACDYVATLAPGSTNQWVIQVLPGYYVEQAFTIPTYCLVQGMGQTPTGNVAHCVQISPVSPWTGGTFITMGSLAAIDNCGIAFTLDASATTDGIGLSGSGRYTRCWFQGVNSASATRNLKMLSGAIAIQNCVVSSGSNNTTLIYSTGGSAIKFCHLSGPDSVGTACNAIVATSGNTSVFFVRFGSTTGTFFNYDIQVIGGAVYVNNSPYKSGTGNITHIDKWRTTAQGLNEAVAATDVVSTLKGAAGQTANLLELKDSADAVLLSIGADGVLHGVDPALFTRQIMFGVPGLANATAWVRVPYACTITSYELTANVSGSCVLDLWKDAYGNFPPTVADTITASSKPTLSAAQKATDAILTGWTKTLAAGDYLMVKVESASGIDFINLALTVSRS